MLLGDKIKKAINDKGITVTEFSKKINKSRNYVYAIFEKDSIDTSLLADIAKALSVPITSFFDDVESKQTYVSGNKNQIGNGNVIIDDCPAQLNEAHKEIEHLKQIIEEKERLIQVLLNK